VLLPPLPLLLLLLLQPAMTSAEVTAMTAPSVLLIRASFLFLAGTRSAEQSSLNLVKSQLGVTESVLNLGFRTTGCLDVARTEAKMLYAVLRGGEWAHLPGRQLRLSDPYPNRTDHWMIARIAGTLTR
jgi:hypothetical protein